MRSVETDGTTIDEAIARALELLHVERDRIEVEILENSTRGVLGFGGKRARVRATVRAPLFAAGDVSRETASAETPTAGTSSVDGARKVFGEILTHLGVAPRFEVDGPGADGIVVFRLAGEVAGIVIGRHGQTLDAIEYLLNRVASQRGGAGAPRISLDVEGYRERRQESLEQTARRAALKAKQTGRPVTLNPMSARDRRIVHLALGDDRDVTTRSQGDGSYRRVIVMPMRGRTRS